MIVAICLDCQHIPWFGHRWLYPLGALYNESVTHGHRRLYQLGALCNELVTHGHRRLYPLGALCNESVTHGHRRLYSLGALCNESVTQGHRRLYPLRALCNGSVTHSVHFLVGGHKDGDAGVSLNLTFPVQQVVEVVAMINWKHSNTHRRWISKQMP